MMKKVTLLFIGMAFAACSNQGAEVIASPDGNVQVSVDVNTEGKIYYSVDFNAKRSLARRPLGSILRRQRTFWTDLNWPQ
jgi:hypothetical protein